MVGLTLAMIRSQWTQAVTVFLLAMLAVAAAVAAPVYAEMAGRAIAAAEVAAAPISQRTLTAIDSVQVRAADDDPLQVALVDDARRRDFEHRAPSLLQTEGFATVSAVSFPGFINPIGAAPVDKNGSLEFREEFCEHIVLTVGRCVAAPGEVVVSEARAAVGLAVSSTAAVMPAKYISGGPGVPGVWVPDGSPCPLAVVGVYRAADRLDPYWGLSSADLGISGGEPVLTDRRTVAACVHNAEAQEVVAYPLPGTLTVDRIGAVRNAVSSTVDNARGTISVSSQIPALLNAMERDRTVVAQMPATAAVPLIGLSWLVLFLAITYTAQSRRSELGIVKLRGIRPADQWWIAAGESVIPVLAGAATGYVVGHLGVLLYGRWVFGSDATVPVSLRPWPYAALALAGASVAAGIALRRDLAASAADLLRRVPARGARWGNVTLGFLLAVLAVVAVAQLRAEPLGDQAAGGLALLAPALMFLSVSLLCAAALDPIAARLGGWCLRTGRLGLAIAALQLGRRRAGSHLFAIVVIGAGLLGFAATAAVAAGEIRREQVAVDIGAPRVLSVSEVSPAILLRMVREIDPRGDYAMAAVAVEPAPGGRRVLALDTTRLTRAALWPTADASMTADQAASKLRPREAESTVVYGGSLSVTVDAAVLDIRTPPSTLHLQVGAAPLDGSPAHAYDLGALRPGRQTYAADLNCRDGCRLTAMSVVPSGAVDGEFRLIIESVNQPGTVAPVVSPAELGDWMNRNPETLRADRVPAGMALSGDSTLFAAGGMSVTPPDTPIPLPVLEANGIRLPTLDLANGERIPSTTVGAPGTLPRLGNVGVLTDLEYLIRSGDLAVASREGEIWLGPEAPADAAQRFRAAGLAIAGERRFDDELAAAARRPSATGVQFLLVAAALALLLGVAGLIVATGVERRERAGEVRALRVQGLSRSHARSAALIGYAGLVGAATIVGWLCGALVWAATRDRLPLVDLRGRGLAIPFLPSPAALAAWALGAAVLLLLAAAFSAVLTRTIEHAPRARQE